MTLPAPGRRTLWGEKGLSRLLKGKTVSALDHRKKKSLGVGKRTGEREKYEEKPLWDGEEKKTDVVRVLLTKTYLVQGAAKKRPRVRYERESAG